LELNVEITKIITNKSWRRKKWNILIRFLYNNLTFVSFLNQIQMKYIKNKNYALVEGEKSKIKLIIHLKKKWYVSN
jgi:hypothetical protein